MKYFAIIGALALTGCLPFEEHKTIVVNGEATVELAPDSFSVSAEIHARSDVQALALKNAARTLAAIRTTLPKLEKLSAISIDASAAKVAPIYDLECVQKAYYGSEATCPIEGRMASIEITVTGQPAELSGQAISMLSELGAESVKLGEFALTDMATAQKQADAQAIKDAAAKAANIAEAAGAMLVGPTRIQFGEGFRDESYAELRPLVVSAPPRMTDPGATTVTPETELDLGKRPIIVNSKVTAAFRIE
jgi:hypothetical protein